MLLTVILSWSSYQRKKALFSLASWVVIIFVIIAVYAFRYELLDNRVIATIMPGYGYTGKDNSINFEKASDGHFYINATINGVTIKFLVDTGASDISLSPSDARKLGLNPDDLFYSEEYNTANGIVEGAPIRIKHMKIGQFEIGDRAAVVNKAKMKYSLLGMKLLSDFTVNISGGTITLRYLTPRSDDLD